MFIETDLCANSRAIEGLANPDPPQNFLQR